MKFLNELTTSQVVSIVLGNKTLAEKFYDRIYESEMDMYLNEKLDCFENGCVNYEIGVYCPCHFSIKRDDWGCHYDFLVGVENCIKNFCSSERVERLARQCRKLTQSNLFMSKVKKLCELFYEDEIKPIVEFVEECSYSIHNQDVTDTNLYDYIDLFVENYGEDYYVEDDGRVFKVATEIK